MEDPICGWYHALVEARIPFEMVHSDLLDLHLINHFKALILPNIATLSDVQCQQLRDYVSEGGSIIATYETSLYDEWGNHREDFGLADLFGAHFDSGIEAPMQNSYLRIEQEPDGSYHPILRGIENAGRIINGTKRVLITHDPSLGNPPLTLIPSYPDLPMEMVWVRVPKTNIPGVIIRKYGKGTVIYFPMDIDRTFWDVMCADHGKLMANAVQVAINWQLPVYVNGAEVVEVTAWKQKKSMTVHLVNLTNPMMMKGPIRELFPVGEQIVSLQIPDEKKVKRVYLLRAKITPSVTQQENNLTIRVPSILDHEVVAIDLE